MSLKYVPQNYCGECSVSNRKVKKWKMLTGRLVKRISNGIRAQVIFNLWACIQAQLLVTKNLLHLGILRALVESFRSECLCLMGPGALSFWFFLKQHFTSPCICFFDSDYVWLNKYFSILFLLTVTKDGLFAILWNYTWKLVALENTFMINRNPFGSHARKFKI